jgi:hypothetical protein
MATKKSAAKKSSKKSAAKKSARKATGAGWPDLPGPDPVLTCIQRCYAQYRTCRLEPWECKRQLALCLLRCLRVSPTDLR